jgi:hypothetical protein
MEPLAVLARRRSDAMTDPQEQFTEHTRRTQENIKNLWQQWSERSTELLKGVRGRTPSMGNAPGDPEEVLDAVFDFAENLIAQQRVFAKQMLKAASKGQEMVAGLAGTTEGSSSPTAPSSAGVPLATTVTPGEFPAGDQGH